MTARGVRWAGALVGVAAGVVGGAAAGGWWWIGAVVVATTAVASTKGRGAAVGHASATLGLTAGAVVAGRPWAAVVLVVGVVATVEAGALADRATVVREQVAGVEAIGWQLVSAALVALGVVAVTTVAPGAAVPLTIIAVLGGGVVVVASAGR